MIKKFFYIFIILQIQCIETSQDRLASVKKQTLGRVYPNIPFNGQIWEVQVVNVLHSTVENVLNTRSYMDRNQHHLFIYSDHPGYLLECKLQKLIKKDA